MTEVKEKIKVTDHVRILKDGSVAKKSGRPTTAESRHRGHKGLSTITKRDGRVLTQKRVAGNSRASYSDKQKMEAVCCFAVCGNSRRVSEITGIQEATIRTWKQTEWWFETMQRIVAEEDEELDTKLTKLINKAVDNVNDRLDNGDLIYDTKRGTLVRKPMSGKDTAIVTAITLDKRQLLRGQPTSRVEKVSQDERLLRLAEQFRSFSNAKEVVQIQDSQEELIVIPEGDNIAG